ncbi:hypothetical protein [Myceligenerans indicum]|uniref:hypothetical protein n=1 Tax=Myceligenerans indicum TaxID=2593663 RepID=UPI00191EDAED|nr:hypothetical protein [Myceligenerans indicum]
MTLTANGATIRRRGSETEHHDLSPADRQEWLDTLDPHLTPDETTRLRAALSRWDAD